MATNKKAVKFYASAVVEQHLDTIPTQLRTNWINSALTAAIEARADEQSELSKLRVWLQNNQESSPRLYAAIADMLVEYGK